MTAVDLEPGHVADELVHVAADVAHHVRRAALRGSRRQRSRAGIWPLDGGRERALPIARLDQMHRADAAGLDHRAHLADHRIAAVVVGQAEDPAGGFDLGGDRPPVGHRVGQRLVADDVQPGLERLEAEGAVRIVGGGDGDGIEPAFGDHFGQRREARQPQRCRIGERLRRVGRQHGTRHLEPVVEPGRRAMHRPDQGTDARRRRSRAAPAPIRPPSSAHPPIKAPAPRGCAPGPRPLPACWRRTPAPGPG
jgi:hypothetical protein